MRFAEKSKTLIQTNHSSFIISQQLYATYTRCENWKKYIENVDYFQVRRNNQTLFEC